MFKQFHQIYIDIYPEIELRRPKTFSSHYSVPSRRCVRSVTGEEYLELWHFCKSHLPAAIPIEFLDTCKWGLITQHSSATGHFLWKFLCNNLLVRETEYIPLTNCISIYVLQSTCPFVTFSECLSGFKIKAFYITVEMSSHYLNSDWVALCGSKDKPLFWHRRPRIEIVEY